MSPASTRVWTASACGCERPLRSALYRCHTQGCMMPPGRPAEAAMSTNQPDIAKFQRAVGKALHEHWVLFLVEGVVLLVLGATAVVLPLLATLALTIIIEIGRASCRERV